MTTKQRRQRATVIVEWEHGGVRGVIVHACPDGLWILPGGGIERSVSGQEEEALVAAVRELHEETGLEAVDALFLFPYAGPISDHHVFLVQARGTPQLVDVKEAPAIGVADAQLNVTWLLVTPGFDVTTQQPMNSMRAILQRYHELRLQNTALWQGLAALTGFRIQNSGFRSTEAVTFRNQDSELNRSNTAMEAPAAGNRSSRQLTIGAAMLELIEGDIVVQDVDAVVNAANEDLANGGGVCGALHRGAGARDLEAACDALGHCPTGEARITPGFKLKARHIIHAVGPVYRRKDAAESGRLLASAYRASLEVASAHGLRSVAFPSLSTGIFGYPVAEAAPIAVQTVADYLRSHPEIALVRFVLRDDTMPAFEQALGRL
jgi:O-acetyl-ADP-ribose deacetylase (regulator of RNase III)/8-oxo-dGTP pyrophosphatase MutT (NUDIX family)